MESQRDDQIQWLDRGEQVKSAFYKFANVRCVPELDIEDIYQDVMSDLVMNVDIDPSFAPQAAKSYVLRKLKGRLLDWCRSKDYLSRRQRDLIKYIEGKIRRGKPLEQVLEEQNMTLEDWVALHKPDPVDFELGLHSDILVPLIDSHSNSFADMHASGIIYEDDDSDVAFVEKVKGAVNAFFETLEKRHKVICYCYFLADKNLREIGSFLGVTESRVSQMLSDITSDAPVMHKVLQSLKNLPPDGMIADEARTELKESLLADISLELDDEENAALAGFLAYVEEKIPRHDLFDVLQSVSSAFNKLSI